MVIARSPTLLLLQFSVWTVVLILAAVPAFVAETRFAGEACLFCWRAPETREQNQGNPDCPRRLCQGGSAHQLGPCY